MIMVAFTYFGLTLFVQAVYGFEFHVEPRRVTVPPGQPANILCRADVALNGCRFLLAGATVVDLSAGTSFPATSDYKYFGTGLQNGQCGITVMKPPEGFNVVSCQGRAVGGGWKKDSMFLRVTRTPTLPWEVVHPTIHALPGESVNLLCRSKIPLGECRIGILPTNQWLNFVQGTMHESTPEFRYYGKGLENGQCGVTILKVTEAFNGEVRCVGIVSERWAGDFVTIVVAKSPNAPVLRLASNDLNDRSTLEATCTVSNGRPAANITWYLAGKEVQDGIMDSSPNDAWFDYDVQTAAQTLKRRVTWRDHGKELKCVANHIALFDYVNQDSEVIRVKFGPQDMHQPDNQPELVIGQQGTINVELLANPKPQLTWYIGSNVVNDDDMDSNGKFKALPAVNKGFGKWEAKLSIQEVSADDFNNVVQLQARNQHGSNNYRVVFARGALHKVPATPRPTSKPPSNYDICGHPLVSVQLIVSGNKTTEGHWPWIAALFAKRTKKAGLEFQCGGTLISKRHVITAAHCIKTDSRTTLTKDDLLIFLGKYSLNDWAEPHSQLKKISSVHTHPDYMGGAAANGSDVAILKLETPASYTSHIRPICLWNRRSSLHDVVGKEGIVVGWGRFSPGDTFVSDIPLMGSSMIASQEECLRSNTDFLFLTSGKTFCAGNRDGGGPCNGDSGSGLVIPYKTGTVTQWFLRGIVSLSLLDRSTAMCDLNQYVIYTDVAQFSDWINQIVT